MTETELQTQLDKENLRPDVTVPVEMVAERDYSAEQIDALAKAGNYLIRGDRMKFLRDLGMHAEQLGALRQYKGGIILTLDGVTRAINKVMEVIEDDSGKYKLKERLEAGKLLAYLTGQLSKLTSGAIKMDRDVAEVVMGKDQQRRQSFQPGTVVKI